MVSTGTYISDYQCKYSEGGGGLSLPSSCSPLASLPPSYFYVLDYCYPAIFFGMCWTRSSCTYVQKSLTKIEAVLACIRLSLLMASLPVLATLSSPTNITATSLHLKTVRNPWSNSFAKSSICPLQLNITKGQRSRSQKKSLLCRAAPCYRLASRLPIFPTGWNGSHCWLQSSAPVFQKRPKNACLSGDNSMGGAELRRPAVGHL